MKAKRRKQLKEKRDRIAAGLNNGWLNFCLAIDCKDCQGQEDGDLCQYTGDYLNFAEDRKCIRDAYEAKKSGLERQG